MRDPQRIDRILELVREQWRKNPDWRLCQLLSNAVCFANNCIRLNDMFSVEDDYLEKALARMGDDCDKQ